MWRSGAIALLTLQLALLPGAARAALELTSLALTVASGGASGVDTSFQVTLTVTGTDIASASVTPAGLPAISLNECDDSHTRCTVTLPPLANQAALDALLPTTVKNYTLALTGTTPPTPASTLTDTFAFARPVVSSPAISAPVAGSTVGPGTVEVKFVACTVTAVAATPATCAATQGVLLKGSAEIETKTDLAASATSWTPATALTEQSAFSARITHAAAGEQSFTADGIGTGTDDDSYLFTTNVTRSDQVAFSTGFSAPTGEFCIVVNDDPADALIPTAPTECALVVEPAAGILDTSDSCTTSAAGIPVQYGFQLAANGSLSGIADADVDGDGSFETHADLTGRLKGKDGLLRQRLRARFGAPGSDTRFRLRIREQADLASLQGALSPPLEWLVEQATRGKAAGAKLSENVTIVSSLPTQPGDGIQCLGGAARTGWKLSFILTGSDGPTSGTLQLANGVSIALTAKESFDSGSNQTDVKFESAAAERGVRMRVKRLEIDSTKQINSGAVRFRAFGQGGSVILPTTVPVTTTTSTTTTTTAAPGTTTTTTTTAAPGTTTTTSTTLTPGQ